MVEYIVARDYWSSTPQFMRRFELDVYTYEMDVVWSIDRNEAMKCSRHDALNIIQTYMSHFHSAPEKLTAVPVNDFVANYNRAMGVI